MKSAIFGNLKSKYKIGHMYLYGEGCEVNYELAMEWYEKAKGFIEDAYKLSMANAYFFKGMSKNALDIIFDMSNSNDAKLLLIEHLVHHATIDITADMLGIIYELIDTVELDKMTNDALKVLLEAYETTHPQSCLVYLKLPRIRPSSISGR